MSQTGRQMNSETGETSEDRQPESRTAPRGKSRTALEKEFFEPSKLYNWGNQNPIIFCGSKTLPHDFFPKKIAGAWMVNDGPPRLRAPAGHLQGPRITAPGRAVRISKTRKDMKNGTRAPG